MVVIAIVSMVCALNWILKFYLLGSCCLSNVVMGLNVLILLSSPVGYLAIFVGLSGSFNSAAEGALPSYIICLSCDLSGCCQFPGSQGIVRVTKQRLCPLPKCGEHVQMTLSTSSHLRKVCTQFPLPWEKKSFFHYTTDWTTFETLFLTWWYI